MKNGSGRIRLHSKFPAMSIFVLLLQYANLRRGDRAALRLFDVAIATGHNSQRALAGMMQTLSKPLATIFPRFLDREFPISASLCAKQALGINPTRFVF